MADMMWDCILGDILYTHKALLREFRALLMDNWGLLTEYKVL